ncbi:MAG TPA: glycoside hydrolase family 20 zincin-like fold domain-containing protein [Anaerolineae bacterium]
MPENKSPILLPAPRHQEFRAGFLKLEPGKRIALLGGPAQDFLFSAGRLQQALRDQLRVDWTLAATATGSPDEIGAVLRIDSTRVQNRDGYDLDVTPENIEVVAGSPRGIYYAVCTLVQLIAQSSGRRLPCLHISDAPDFANRGVMLDISRNRVLTMPQLFELVDLLASWKINQLQLYTEHTFTYRNHREVWEHASPITEQEILELDSFCRDRFIELVPNQNSFGHMRPWLIHDRYRDLAECPDGCDTIWGHFDQPFSLNPLDPRSLALVEELYDELLPNFTSRQFNVGCDETVDLGQGRSQAECAARGTASVYLDFVLKVYQATRARGHTMMYWGDIVVQHPELIPQLPKDAIMLDWGYEADYPFEENGARFAANGIPYYVCAGTSTWNSICGRTDNAIGNLSRAAEGGLRHGALGYLITDWGDNGHWQSLPFSYLGFAYGAAVAWSLDANRDLDISRALSAHAFRDSTGALGQAAYALGKVSQELGNDPHNATLLFRILQTPVARIRAEIGGLTPATLKRTQRAIERVVRPTAGARSPRPDARLLVDEFAAAATLLQHACKRALLALEDNPVKVRAQKRELARDLDRFLKEYRRLWLARTRPGGLKDSVALFKKMRKDYDA